MSVRMSEPRGSLHAYNDAYLAIDSPLGVLCLSKEEIEKALERAGEYYVAFGSVSGQSPEFVERGAEKILDAEAAGEVLGVPPSWLLQRARERRIPFVQLGKYVRFDVERIRIEMTKSPQ